MLPLFFVYRASVCSYCYLLPSESHPLERLLSVFGAVCARELKEVVSFQVAGLLAA